jgi:hypothetical protein
MKFVFIYNLRTLAYSCPIGNFTLNQSGFLLCFTTGAITGSSIITLLDIRFSMLDICIEFQQLRHKGNIILYFHVPKIGLVYKNLFKAIKKLQKIKSLAVFIENIFKLFTFSSQKTL